MATWREKAASVIRATIEANPGLDEVNQQLGARKEKHSTEMTLADGKGETAMSNQTHQITDREPVGSSWTLTDAADKPTREQMCEELARQMGWHKCEHRSFGQDRWETEQGDVHVGGFNPFTNHADCAALMVWLVTQNAETQERFELVITTLLAELPDDMRCVPLYYLTAPLPVIAEAAWRAIQSNLPR